ncbi:tRNA modification GTPase MnmE [Dissostichus eleginoides]|uniref:tRNA modification GTPase MnmE n=1 Tax=Dissostichus eleginoides TaxID=100907 RepID=A0AAD9ENA4_DISEL|nr:tRNA modification GTPase MnmE [Dissostichus eleginoides]
MENACPLCNREYTALNQHLRVSHLVQNIEERGKLVLLASRRLNIRSEACPVQSCDAQKGTRLDRHMKRSHTELSDGAKTQLLDNLKRRLILGSLGALRASNPSVPMVSTLDLDEAADTLLEEYKELQEGPHPDAKLRHNVQNKLYRIRHFIGWMSKGQSGLAKLQFLDNQTRLKGWAGYLVDCGMVRTTSLHYLKNVRQFLVYVQETPPKTSRLGQKNVRMGIRYLNSVIKGWNRHVVQHQMSVKGRKDAVMHTVAELQQCRRLARLAIPKLLSKLENQHSNSSLWKLQGYVAAYLASLYGHRLGVFLNMTDLEVSEAVHGDKDDYLLKVNT